MKRAWLGILITTAYDLSELHESQLKIKVLDE